jgi:hypothetical protein
VQRNATLKEIHIRFCKKCERWNSYKTDRIFGNKSSEVYRRLRLWRVNKRRNEHTWEAQNVFELTTGTEDMWRRQTDCIQIVRSKICNSKFRKSWIFSNTAVRMSYLAPCLMVSFSPPPPHPCSKALSGAGSGHYSGSRSHSDTPHLVGSTLRHTTLNRKHTQTHHT